MPKDSQTPDTNRRKVVDLHTRGERLATERVDISLDEVAWQPEPWLLDVMMALDAARDVAEERLEARGVVVPVDWSWTLEQDSDGRMRLDVRPPA